MDSITAIRNLTKPWGSLATGFLAAAIFVGLLCIASDINYLQVLALIQDEDSVSVGDVEYAEALQAAGYLLLIAIHIPALALFLIWVYATRRRLDYLAVEGLRFSPGWAVGWFFVPIMKYFRPFQVMAEIWRASAPDLDTRATGEWKELITPPSLGFWWLIWVASEIADFVVGRMLSTANSPAEQWAVELIGMGLVGMGIVVSALTIQVIRMMEKRQKQKIDSLLVHVSTEAEGGWPPAEVLTGRGRMLLLALFLMLVLSLLGAFSYLLGIARHYLQSSG